MQKDTRDSIIQEAIVIRYYTFSCPLKQIIRCFSKIFDDGGFDDWRITENTNQIMQSWILLSLVETIAYYSSQQSILINYTNTHGGNYWYRHRRSSDGLLLSSHRTRLLLLHHHHHHVHRCRWTRGGCVWGSGGLSDQSTSDYYRGSEAATVIWKIVCPAWTTRAKSWN